MNFPTPQPGHVNCAMCRMLNVPGCAACRRCKDCGCRCRACANCGTKHDKRFTCRVCNRCKRPSKYPESMGIYHCTCRARPKAMKVFTNAPGPKLFRSLTLRRPVGLEIELSNPGDMVAIQRGSRVVPVNWVHDGSITAGGQELVVMPMLGQQLVEELDYLTESFRRFECAVDTTCGYHVHIGAEDFGAFELRRLFLLYHRYENLFYELVTPGRDKAKRNPRGELKCYCARWPWKAEWYERLMALKRAPEIRRYLIEALYPERVMNRRIDMGGARRHKYEACRYLGLNLHTWFERGTVEYRHHEGTMDREALLYWALWCGWFTEFASALSDRQVMRMHTLDDLLFAAYNTGRSQLRMPSDIATYVLRTREEKHNVKHTEPEPVPTATAAAVTVAV